jgi:hypothetical protein
MAATSWARCVSPLLVLGLVAACDGGIDAEQPAPLMPPTMGRWEMRAPMPAPGRYYVGVGAAGGKLFVVGGFGTMGEGRFFQSYDPATDTWQTHEALAKDFVMPNVAGVGSKLYILGALAVTDVLEYDVERRTFTAKAPLPPGLERGRGVAAVGVWGTKILLAGGILPGQSANQLNTGMRMREFVVYDTAANTWQAMPDLPQARGYAMSAVVGDKFWVAGGSTDRERTSQVDIFDLTAGAWTNGPPLPESLSSGGAGVVRGHLHLVGGIATSMGTITPLTHVLDGTTGAWTTAAPMQTPRFAMGAAVIGDKLYVPGGIAGSMTFLPNPTLEVFVP